jgi:CubicO group peptidase (beta-lactamase class C family)
MRAALWALAFVALVARAQTYYPDADWQHKAPEQAGYDAALLREAIDFAIGAESRNPRDLTLNHYQTFGREPYGNPIGPIKDRGEPSGVIVRRGYLVAEWGEPSRVDMTHSVTKSFLSSIAGVAYDRGLIRSIDDRARDYVPPIAVQGSSELLYLFETPHNRQITWQHLLRQTSDWEGTLWGKPDWADRPSNKPQEWLARRRDPPGSAYKYNDVRVNAFALALLNVWRRPLPEVLKEAIMDPIGASTTWRWYGYENSWIVLDGKLVQSVSGGGHWGGGMFINAYDMARFGYLTLRRGRWKERRLLSEQWVQWALTPTPVQPGYGFMNWYNNRDGKLLPSAPPSAFAHLGNGTNMIYVDPEQEVVAVVRWIERDALDGFVKRLRAAAKQ